AHGSEDVAVALMKAGATDYLPKDRDHGAVLPQRLRAAVRVHRAEERSRQALRELEAERQLMKGVLEQTGAGVTTARAPRGELVLSNREAEHILGQRYRASHTAAAQPGAHVVHDKQGARLAPERWP